MAEWGGQSGWADSAEGCFPLSLCVLDIPTQGSLDGPVALVEEERRGKGAHERGGGVQDTPMEVFAA